MVEIPVTNSADSGFNDSKRISMSGLGVII